MSATGITTETGRCISHLAGSVRISETIGLILDLIPFIIGFRIYNNIVFVVFPAIWIVRVVFCPTKKCRSILGQLSTNNETSAGLNSLNRQQENYHYSNDNFEC